MKVLEYASNDTLFKNVCQGISQPVVLFFSEWPRSSVLGLFPILYPNAINVSNTQRDFITLSMLRIVFKSLKCLGFEAAPRSLQPDGKLNDEFGSLRFVVLDPDVAVVIRYDRIHNGKPQACSMFLG